jgi:hypothetical protein
MPKTGFTMRCLYTGKHTMRIAIYDSGLLIDRSHLPVPTQPMLKEFQLAATDFETPTESRPARATSQESKWPF